MQNKKVDKKEQRQIVLKQQIKKEKHRSREPGLQTKENWNIAEFDIVKCKSFTKK